MANRYIDEYTRSARNQTSLQRKISRYEHDPIRFETGRPAEDLKLGTIKAVRIG